MSPLARKLVVEVIGRQADYDPADPPDPQPFGEPGHTPTLKVGEWTFVRIQNHSDQRLNIATLDLQPDWGISQVYPSGPGDKFIEFEPGQVVTLPLQASLPDGYDQGTDVLKVFATIGSPNFRWLELPALDQPLAAKGISRDAASDPLDQLLAALAAEQPPTRNLDLAAAPSKGWVTAEVEVRVQRTE
jgi:hypothetical protein